MSEAWWPEALSLANVFFGLFLALACWRQAARLRGFMRWLMAVLGLIGLYWGGLYVFIFVTPVGIYDPVWFGQIFVRPMFTFTLAVMASMALYRWRV